MGYSRLAQLQGFHPCPMRMHEGRSGVILVADGYSSDLCGCMEVGLPARVWLLHQPTSC